MSRSIVVSYQMALPSIFEFEKLYYFCLFINRYENCRRFNIDNYCGIHHRYVNDVPISSLVYIAYCCDTEVGWAAFYRCNIVIFIILV